MKTTVLTLMMVACFCFQSQAQVPNGGFETWTGNDPDGWVTTNGLMQLGNPQSVFQSSDAHSGTSACEIRTINVVNKIPGVGIPDFTGSVFTGKQVFTTSYFGFPYSQKPSMLRFWYKYNARSNDTASILAYTTRWDAALNKRDTLAIAMSKITDSVGVYTKREVYFYVMDSIHTPDSAVVLFASSSVLANKVGAVLLLDDVEFAGGNVGISESTQLAFSIFPNPVIDGNVQLIFQQSEALVTVNVFDVQGRKVFEQQGKALTGKLSVSTSMLPSGIYMVSVHTAEGFGVKRLIID